MSKVGLYDLSAAHLISYHPDKDLLPIVLANCNYSFEVGQGTKVEYDFRNIERQVIDRFLFSKSVITEIEKVGIIIPHANQVWVVHRNNPFSASPHIL